MGSSEVSIIMSRTLGTGLFVASVFTNMFTDKLTTAEIRELFTKLKTDVETRQWRDILNTLSESEMTPKMLPHVLSVLFWINSIFMSRARDNSLDDIHRDVELLQRRFDGLTGPQLKGR